MSVHPLHLLEGMEALGALSSLPCQSAAWLHFVGGKRGEKTKKAEMVNYSVLEKNRIRSTCGSDENSTFPFCLECGGQRAPENRK